MLKYGEFASNLRAAAPDHAVALKNNSALRPEGILDGESHFPDASHLIERARSRVVPQSFPKVGHPQLYTSGVRASVTQHDRGFAFRVTETGRGRASPVSRAAAVGSMDRLSVVYAVMFAPRSGVVYLDSFVSDFIFSVPPF